MKTMYLYVYDNKMKETLEKYNNKMIQETVINNNRVYVFEETEDFRNHRFNYKSFKYVTSNALIKNNKKDIVYCVFKNQGLIKIFSNKEEAKQFKEENKGKIYIIEKEIDKQLN